MSYQPVRPNKKVKGRKTAAYSRRKNRVQVDAALDANPLLAYLRAHSDWLLFTGYAATTVDAGMRSLCEFARWCDTRAIESPAQLSLKVLEQYQRHLFLYRKADGEPLTVGSQHQHLTALKRFGKWLARERHLPYNPASELILPRVPHRIPRTILTLEEIERIAAQADTGTPVGLRDRTLIEVLYSTGLRRLEMARLATWDIDYHRSLVLVREGKGGSDRLVPIGSRALYWLNRYVLEAREELTTGGHEKLWVTDFGEPMQAPLLAHIVKHLMEKAGVNKTGSCHLFRHAMATHMLENGADTRFIQVMLGHRKLETTQIYTAVSMEKLKEIHAATHPARLNGPASASDHPAQADTLADAENAA